jgi:putative MFS transporter
MNDNLQNKYLKKQLADAKFSTVHFKIWVLCSFGIFLDGLDLSMISMALPLINKEFNTTSLEEGLIASSAVLGMMLGAFLGGVISDKIGRKKIYFIDLIAFFILTLCTAFSPNILSLIILRFLLGIALGADYPASASYISELMPSKIRGRMLALAIMQFVVGRFLAAIIALLALKFFWHIASWRIMLGFCALPALIVGWFRLKMFESPYWLISKGDIDKAITIISLFCQKSQDYLKKNYDEIKRLNNAKEIEYNPTVKLFIKENIKSILLITIPWFLFDIVAFGIGTFTPIILSMIIHAPKTHEVSTSLSQIFTSIEAMAFLGVIAFLGYSLGTFLVEKIGRLKLQIIGFITMAFGLSLIAFFGHVMVTAKVRNVVIFIGFSIYYFCANMGPACVTFILPNELFSTRIRAKAHGFATMTGKLGAFLGMLFMPQLIDKLHLSNTMLIFSMISLLAYFITFKFGKETKALVLD